MYLISNRNGVSHQYLERCMSSVAGAVYLSNRNGVSSVAGEAYLISNRNSVSHQ